MEKDKPNNQEQQQLYKNENQMLRALHEERQKRKMTERLKNEIQEEDSIERSIRKGKIDEKQDEKNERSQSIYLNSLIYDKRNFKEKVNSISIPSFFQDDPKVFPKSIVSPNVESILITTFGYEMQVFQPILNTIAHSKVKFFLVNREKDEKSGGEVKRNAYNIKNFILIQPPKKESGYGVFHTKLWLIKFKTFLRVMVCTSNNHQMDWAVWQNAYWYQDFPLQVKGHFVSGQQPTKSNVFDRESDFVSTLKMVIENLQPSDFDLLKQMECSFENYDFKKVEVILIPSISGRHKAEQMDKVGIQKIKKMIKGSNIVWKGKPVVTYNTTSLGRLDEDFLRDFYLSFCPSAKALGCEIKIRLVYPTSSYIVNETCREAQVLFLTSENYAKCAMKNTIFHRYEASPQNGVQGGIPHLKTIIVDDEESPNCILYVGSHNMTKAAWGKYEKNATQLNCSNEELGLLFLQYDKTQLLKWLPYQYPPPKYSTDDLPFIKDQF